MKIALHARELYTAAKHHPGGIARVNRSIVESLPLAMPGDHFTAFLRPDAEPNLAHNARRKLSLQKVFQNDSLGAMFESFVLGSDVSYSLATQVPAKAKGLRVGIFHDAVPITHPELLAKPTDAYSNPSSEARRIFDSLKTADLVHCGSEHARGEAEELLGIPKSRSFVAYHGLHMPAAPESLPHQNQRVLLTVSRLDPRKNLGRLIEAFDSISHLPDMEGVVLRIVGNPGWRVEEIHRAVGQAKSKDRIELLGHVTDVQLTEFYCSAEWYICPSITEGFGLPILEAMHYGCPCICSTGGAIPEVGGTAALYFSPTSVEELGARILEAFQSDRAEYSQKSKTNAQRFSPEAMCAKISEALRNLTS